MENDKPLTAADTYQTTILILLRLR